jgi:chromosome segregation ATPase
MLNKLNYVKKDNHQYILDNVHSLINPDYYKLLEFIDKFRSFSEYSFDCVDVHLENIENEPDGKNKKEVHSAQIKIIKSLENKLTEILTKYNSATQFIEELTANVNKSTLSLLDKNREIERKELQILKLENKLNEAHKSFESDKKNIIDKLVAEHEINILTYKKQLHEANCFKAQCSALDITMDDLKTELGTANLNIQREKDISKGLLNQIIAIKGELTQTKEDNLQLLKTMSEYTNANKNLNNVNSEYEKIISKLKIDNKFLSEQVTDKYSKQNDELFTALNSRIKELENELQKSNDILEQTKTEKIKSNMELGNIKQILSKIRV